MKQCGYCGATDFMYEEETGREYCTRCGHYTGCTATYGGIDELGGDY